MDGRNGLVFWIPDDFGSFNGFGFVFLQDLDSVQVFYGLGFKG